MSTQETLSAEIKGLSAELADLFFHRQTWRVVAPVWAIFLALVVLMANQSRAMAGLAPIWAPEVLVMSVVNDRARVRLLAGDEPTIRVEWLESTAPAPGNMHWVKWTSETPNKVYLQSRPTGELGVEGAIDASEQATFETLLSRQRLWLLMKCFLAFVVSFMFVRVVLDLKPQKVR